DPAPVVDKREVSVAAVPARVDDPAVARGVDGAVAARADVRPLVVGGASGARRDTVAERARDAAGRGARPSGIADLHAAGTGAPGRLDALDVLGLGVHEAGLQRRELGLEGGVVVLLLLEGGRRRIRR